MKSAAMARWGVGMLVLMLVVKEVGLSFGQHGRGEAMAGDWPRFRGPNNNGISTETGLLKEWPEDGPKLLWMIEGLGIGFSTVYMTLHHAVDPIAGYIWGALSFFLAMKLIKIRGEDPISGLRSA